ncbi:MAG: hypothetical protein K8T89_04735 [Planctomycetes bacterium]|nr:hypothetical protein [Planctomycetota bacterium]
MRPYFFIYLVVVMLAIGSAVAEEPNRALVLPTVPAGTVKDLTPPELHHAAEVHEHAEAHHEGGFYGAAEYLLLRPRQRTLDYALIDAVNDITPRGDLQSVRYDTRSGLRAGLGYRFAESGWDVGFFYTYLHSRGNEFARAPAGGLLYPTLTRPGLTDSALTAIARSRLDYNIYDFEFGKTMNVDEWTQIRLYGGVRFASIRQSLNATYNGRLADSAFAESRSNFEGAGPILGTEFRWKVVKNFSVFTKASGGLIYGRNRSALFETNNGGGTVYTDVASLDRPIVPMIGLALGATWQYRGFSFTGGYQAVNWFSLVQRPTLIDDFSEGKTLPRTSDLSLDGFFFQLGFQF